MVAPAAIALTLFFGAQELVLHMTQYTQDGAAQIVWTKRRWVRESSRWKVPQDKHLVFFMGDSKIAGGLIPEVFDRETGTTYSYNLSLPGMPLGPHYFLIEEHLKKNPPPKAIVMKLDLGLFEYFHFQNYALLGAGIREAAEYAIWDGDGSILVNFFFPIRYFWPDAKRYIVSRIYKALPPLIQDRIKRKYLENVEDRETYEHNWDAYFETLYVSPEKRTRDRRRVLEKKRGYYFFEEQAALRGHLPRTYKHDLKKYPPKKLYDEDPYPYLEKLLKLAEIYGTRIILIQHYEHEHLRTKDSIPSLWRNVKAKHPKVMWADARIKYYEPYYFSDPLHLTREGAEDYTGIIASEYRKIMGGPTAEGMKSLPEKISGVSGPPIRPTVLSNRPAA